MEKINPSIDYDLVTATIKFKEWKGKLTYYVFIIDSNMDINEEVQRLVTEWRKKGVNKKRTIENVTIAYSLNIKV